jgi:hypothetical protein
MAGLNLGKDPRTGEDVILSIKERLRGLYCLGTTGTGKTTFLVNLALQDIKAGRGLCFITPVGDAIKDILSRIPPEREKDVILFNPMHTQEIPGLNIFECPDSTSDKEVALTSGFVMDVFAGVWGVGSQTPLLMDVLNNLTVTAVEANLTMGEVPMLLTDSNFRSHVMKSLRNDQVKRWLQDYNNLKPTEQKDFVSSVRNKINAFVTNPMIARIISQTKSTINMRRVMDEGKILLVELDPRLKDKTSLLGSVIIGRILEATYSRADTPQQERRLFVLYVDEFQQYATDDMATLLFEARKFGIATTIAHQVREGQLTEKMKGATLNAANIITLQISSMDAEMAGIFDTTPQTEVVCTEEVRVPRKSVVTPLTISGHESPKVMGFTTNYIVPLNLATKEEVEEDEWSDWRWKYREKLYPMSPVDASYKFDPKDIETGLVYLNEFLYLSMMHKHEEAKKAFYEAARKFSKYLGCYRYFTNPNEKQTLADGAQKNIAKLNQELSEKRAVLESNEAFLEFFAKEGHKQKWHKKEEEKESERKGLYSRLRSLLDKDPLPVPSPTWHCSKDSNWYELDAAYYSSLKAFTNFEYLQSERRKNLERQLTYYTAEKKKYQDEDEYLRWKRGWPQRYFFTKEEKARLQSGEPDRLMGLADSKLYRIRKTLEDDYEGRTCARKLALLCEQHSALDTPEKVIEEKLQAYIEFEFKPLLEKFNTTTEQVRKSIHIQDEQLKREKSRYDAFYNAAMSAAMELEADPIMEGSGAYRDITRQVQTYADRQHGIANTLTHLARFTAWAKLGNIEHVLQMLPLTPRNKVKLSDLFNSIRRRNVEEGFLRLASEVEAEIKARREMFTTTLTSKQKV